MFTALRLALILPVLLLGVSTASARKNKDKDEIAELVQQVKKDWQAKDNTFNKTPSLRSGRAVSSSGRRTEQVRSTRRTSSSATRR
jgi:hypothetical protein